MIHTNIDNPTLTVAIPAYNEVANIERIVREFLSTAYPNLIEVFVADGGSTDGTQDFVKNVALEDARVKLLHNPLKVQSAGLNLILQECTGDIFMRAYAQKAILVYCFNLLFWHLSDKVFLPSNEAVINMDSVKKSVKIDF